MQTERANAKINLYLDVVGRRENGYHDLVSIMQTVSLCDLVSVDYRPSSHTSIRLEASGNDAMPLDRRNLAWRAAELFLDHTQKIGEVRISIEKHIPMAAGLAGGSSDAAAVLRGLNRLCGSPLSKEQLCTLGARLGADIPFCIIGGGSLVTGIGDKLGEISSMPNCTLVIACMGEGVSTPWAYAKLDEAYNNFTPKRISDPRPDRIIKAMREDRLKDCYLDFYNLFEEVVPSAQSYVQTLKNVMNEGGASVSMMSGSGPSVFGVFEDMRSAEQVCDRLHSMKAAAFVCHPCGKYM